MTLKEFENLKVGDKVWLITDWFNKCNEGMKAVELEVKGKDEDEQIIQFLGVCFNAVSCSLTKSEAWEKAIKRFDEALKSQEQEVEKDRKALDRYKEELAKARAEEGKQKDRFFVDFNDDVVREQANGIIPQHVEPHLCGLFSSLQEAYVALADYHKRKYEEALVNSGKARFVISCGNKICLVQNLEKAEGNMVWVSLCDGFLLYVPKENVFSTRQEAEAELKRRLGS